MGKTGNSNSSHILKFMTIFLQMEAMNGNCVKFDKELIRGKPRVFSDEFKGQGNPLQHQMDTMSVNSEIA